MRGLLPCPFCGWAAIMREWTSGTHYYRAECSNTEGCDCHGLQHLTLGEAIAAWNRRADARQHALKTGDCPMCEDCPDGCPVETPKDSRNIVANAYRIRSMSDEELAEFLWEQNGSNRYWKSVKKYLDWLKAETEGTEI